MKHNIGFVTRAKCPVCNYQHSTTLWVKPYSDLVLDKFLSEFYHQKLNTSQLEQQPFQIDQCNQCEFIYQPFVLNETGMATLYGEWVDSKTSLKKKKTAKAKLYKQYSGQIEIIARLFKQKPHTINILEFGMGWGYWSRMAQAFGYNVSGLELSPERVEHARSMGLKVIEEIPDDAKYHFIYANQVFEHLENPLTLLKDLTNHLTKNGIIYLRVPDGSGIKDRLINSGWSNNMDAIHPLEHINCFTRKTLIKLAEEAGLKVLNHPIRLNINSLWGGIKREIADRFFTTHIYFTKD